VSNHILICFVATLLITSIHRLSCYPTHRSKVREAMKKKKIEGEEAEEEMDECK
jgi:hypothetical protein